MYNMIYHQIILYNERYQATSKFKMKCNSWLNRGKISVNFLI